MNNCQDSNIYTFNAASVLEAYSAYVEGNPNCTLAAIGTCVSDGQVRNAIQKSAERLGYGLESCAWIDVGSAQSHTLDSGDVLRIVEGIDPVALIAVDAEGARLLCAAYGADAEADGFMRLNGRPVASFADMPGILQSEEGKQKAWRLLKALA